MGASLNPQALLRDATLDDKYDAASGHVFMTGVQALVRLPLMQKQRDREAGLNTAGYITGYRGSPLGTYDDQLRKAGKRLAEHDIVFQPGVNEDLAATAVWGSQQAEARGEGRYDGVFAIWYGKGPGVDRSGDAFRHANLAGTSRHGGVLLLMGDDHTCESSTTCHQSEFALVDAMIPVLSPAGVQEVLSMGLAGWAMSRASGLWVGLKCVKDVADAAAVVDVTMPPPAVEPSDVPMPPDGVHLRQPDTPHAQEHRLHNYKLEAARRFAAANGLDRVTVDAPDAWLGIATHGKSYLDVLQAFDHLGLDNARLERLGVRLYKLGMVWPLEPDGARAFAAGLQSIVVVEEKRSLLEAQLRDILYDLPARPSIVGKKDEAGRTLFQPEMALDPVQVAIALGERIAARTGDAALAGRVEALRGRRRQPAGVVDILQRSFYFCSGCPHNTSTVLPEGSRGYAGIGCGWMAQTMERSTLGYTQMGGEGMSWVGEAPFSRRAHVFQNLGDGTYFHSGLLAIRAAVAAKTPITFKILFNDAVAMTGGQRHDGALTPQRISWQVFAEGATRTAVVTDDTDKYHRAPPGPDGSPLEMDRFAPGVTIHHRDELDAVQKMLRELPGTTVLIYDQTCAAEKRRRRKRGEMPDPAQRVFINELVCEGCGDCGVQSNCVSIQPLETEFGRKRQIDQSSCNKDFSCLKGFCPSFVTVRGGSLKKPAPTGTALAEPPEPALPPLDRSFSLVVTGTGGTGVVTLSAILGMAAHLEGKGCGVLDMAGLAQKGGSVWSHLRFGRTPRDILAIRVAPGSADAVLGCDLLVAASARTLALMNAATRVAVNTHEAMPGQFTRQPDMAFPSDPLLRNILRVAEDGAVDTLDATALATRHLGDAMGANMLMLGYAFQRGLVPVSSAAIKRAIELNGASVKSNLQAFLIGRVAAATPGQLEAGAGAANEAMNAGARGAAHAQSLEHIVGTRHDFLIGYQNRAYADRYRAMVERVGLHERAGADGIGGAAAGALADAVARNYFQLLAYKDEYEVARLYADTGFIDGVKARFDGDVSVSFNLAPPLLSALDGKGVPKKREFGRWMLPAMRVLAACKGLRGTPFDPFGLLADRRLERQLLARYERNLRELTAQPITDMEAALELARLPERIRGFGHVKARNVQAVASRWVELERRLKLSTSETLTENGQPFIHPV